MKPLNRPMFRYGGPIKEGVMSGIREPKKDGGPMNEPQAINTVGSPLAPQGSDGRQQYAFPLLYGLGMAAARVLPAAYRGYKASRYLNPKAVTTGQKIKNFFIPRGSQSLESGGSKYAAKTKAGEGLGYKIGSFARTNPVSTFGIASAVPQAGYGAYKLGKAGIKGAPDLAKNYIDMVLPGEQFREPPPNITGKNNIQDTNRDDRKKIVSGDASKKGGGAEMSAEELRKKNVERYRDIMDIKGMNKDAAYNSLIAASQAINQSGDFKGDIKSGKLINQIIQATSKQFDKPKQTKDAIDTLILKGEIDKDIKASDPSAKLLNEYRLKQMEKIDKDLNTGFAEAKIAASKNLSGQSAIDAAASVASENFKGNLLTKTQLTDVMEAAKGSGEISEQDIIISATTEVIKGKNLPDGDYTVGDVLVTITEGQVTNIKR